MQNGLTAAKAAELLRVNGPNLLPSTATRSHLRIVLGIVREPMLAMLLAAGLAYLLLGSAEEAIVLVCFAGFSIIIAIVQESRTENVLQSLRDLAAPRAVVVRDGEAVRIPGRDVVCGDLLLLEQGDRIAADAVLVECEDLAVDESLLTGESVPVGKQVGDERTEDTFSPGGEGSGFVYSSTMVTNGRGAAFVLATGADTQVGRIGQSVNMLQMEAPLLRKQTGRVVRYAAVAAALVTLAVVLLYGTLRGGWLNAVLAGIAIGMSLLPEEFPVVLTVFLAMGAWRISRAGVLTRRAAAIETLGAATILCTDKTGTLTRNRMSVTDLWAPNCEALKIASASGPMAEQYRGLLAAGTLASAILPTDPMEQALHEAHSAQSDGAFANWRIERTFALSPDFLAMSNAWARPDRSERTVAAKGAPEAIAELCRLTEQERAAMEAAAHDMAAGGVRVLGVAEATVTGAIGNRQQDHVFTLRGLIGLSDPLRPDIPPAVAQCRTAGIRVMMITGDFPVTARAIAQQAGLADGEVLSGNDIDAMDDDALLRRLATVSVCARTMPAQKLRIVEALKRAGEVVAMTGDGVNDAPALKAAHIGIAMGKRGTDVAREAASIVLVEDDFGAIVAAIRLGRRIYDNLRKAMGFIFSAHVPIAGLALMPLLTGLPILFGPIQIALIEMIIDPVCAIAFEAETDEEDVMRRPPRRATEPLFSGSMVLRSLAQGGTAFVLLAALFAIAAAHHLPSAEVRALIFFALVSALFALILVNRAFSRSLMEALLRGNVALRYISAGIVIVGAVIVATPAIRDLLAFGPLSLAQLMVAVAMGVLLLLVLESAKVRQADRTGDRLPYRIRAKRSGRDEQ